MNKKLVLENGMEFRGISSLNSKVGEVKIVTSMVGYQEILSDPMVYNYILVFTYPLIGNYGITDDDYESKNINCLGVICKNITKTPSNYRSTQSLEDVLQEQNIPLLSGVDTRMLTKVVLENNSIKGIITDIEDNCALEKIKNYKDNNYYNLSNKIWYSKTKNHLYNCLVIDLGVKKSLIKNLNALNCNVIVAPSNITYQEVKKLNYDYLILSGGIDSNYSNLFEIIKNEKKSVLGLNIGSSLILKAFNNNINLTKNNIFTQNHPSKNIITNKIQIVSLFNYYKIVDEFAFNKICLDLVNNQILRLEKDNYTLIQYEISAEELELFLNKENKNA